MNFNETIKLLEHEMMETEKQRLVLEARKEGFINEVNKLLHMYFEMKCNCKLDSSEYYGLKNRKGKKERIYPIKFVYREYPQWDEYPVYYLIYHPSTKSGKKSGKINSIGFNKYEEILDSVFAWE